LTLPAQHIVRLACHAQIVDCVVLHDHPRSKIREGKQAAMPGAMAGQNGS
jgi:hypothetical protein